MARYLFTVVSGVTTYTDEAPVASYQYYLIAKNAVGSQDATSAVSGTVFPCSNNWQGWSVGWDNHWGSW